ncbi:MAG: zinc ribbon domain-containing protein [Rhodanobacteraceae bacterium]
MPIYEYAPTTERHCSHCSEGFDCLQKLRDASLTQCPQCGAPVERRLSAPNMAIGGEHLLQESHLEKHGFTQYKRIGKGQYEKTAGKGPSHISDK